MAAAAEQIREFSEEEKKAISKVMDFIEGRRPTQGSLRGSAPLNHYSAKGTQKSIAASDAFCVPRAGALLYAYYQ